MKKISAIFLFGTTALWLAGSEAQAQTQAVTPTPAQPAATGQDDAKSSELQDIIVTATRSGETNLQKTAIAVTALSSTALKERGIANALDLNGVAPNVSIGGRSGAGGLAGAVTIRGIGIDANPPAQPAVGIYVDEVYIPAAFGNLLGTYDLNQLEVLRGPQGTLFGRNTISGALLYTSVKPTFDKISGFLEGTVGNMKRGDVSGALNVPLTSWAALRVSGAYTNRDGYVHDLLNNVYRGSEHNTDARVQLLLQPTSDLLIDLKVEQVYQKSNGPPSTETGFNSKAALYIPPIQQYVSPGYYTDYGVNSPDTFYAKLRIAQGTIAYDLSPNIKLKSITAYSENKDQLQIDQDGTPLAIFAVNRGTNRNKLFTQEFQLAGKSIGARLHWTLGLFYYNEATSNTGSYSSIFGAPPSSNFGDFDVQTKSYAAYGQASFDITDKLSITGGLRYTSDKINLTDINPATGVVVSSTAAYGPNSAKFTNTSPLLGLNYQAASNVFLYAKWSRGFRAGNFSPTLVGAFAFGPETAETYEAGARTELLNHRLRINPTIFLTNWSNIQFNEIAIVGGIPLPIIDNAGNARMKGVEVEAQASVSHDFTLTASGSYLDAKYTKILPAVANIITLNSPLKRAPKFSYTTGGRYVVPVGDGELALNANYVWQSRQRTASSDLDTVPVPAYGLLNARLGYTSPDRRYTISVYSNNLTNVRYIIGGTNYGNGGLIPTTSVEVGRPREFGLTARVNIF